MLVISVRLYVLLVKEKRFAAEASQSLCVQWLSPYVPTAFVAALFVPFGI